MANLLTFVNGEISSFLPKAVDMSNFSHYDTDIQNRKRQKSTSRTIKFLEEITYVKSCYLWWRSLL